MWGLFDAHAWWRVVDAARLAYPGEDASECCFRTFLRIAATLRGRQEKAERSGVRYMMFRCAVGLRTLGTAELRV